jgi:putative DNA primase/helicase
MQLFDRAKLVGLSHVRSWLPQGRQEGAEWVCINPTRSDSKEGSFKVNTDSGRWSDWADDAAGNDIISLYAYINRDRLYTAASNKGYKNLEGGVQTEAAREILENHDPTYFPSDKDDFSPTKSAGGYWEGFREYGRSKEGVVDPIDSIKYHEKLFGKYFKHWIFEDKKGLPLFVVARYYDKDNKKNDRPFCLWTNGTEYRWRSKNLTGSPLPLWGLTQFESKPNHPILMVEGQKNASESKEILGEDFICTSIFRGIDKSDLEPLRGRTVYYWFDPDGAGRKKMAAVKEALSKIDCILHIVHSPTRKEKGWDISDAIEEGWTKQQLIDHIEGQTQDNTGHFVDDKNSYPFRIIGQTATDLYFFPKETCLVMKFKRSALGKANILNIMERRAWGDLFAKGDGGIAWDAATDFLLRWGAEAPIYRNEIVRGAGAWIEKGQLVINTGNSLIINGKEEELYQSNTEYVYEKNSKMPYSVTDPLSIDDASRIMDVVNLLDFHDPAHAMMLAGWILLAPFGGALGWRPHVWLTGAKGAGKSHIMEKIVYPMVSAYGLKALGSSSSAGIRQGLGSCSKPVMIDEAEADTIKKRETIEDVLSMARQASSGAENSADILHGTQDGSGMNWVVKSMFFFASIGPALNHSADKSRVSLLKLKTPRKNDEKIRAENFKKLEKAEEIITYEWAKSFHSRTLSLWPELIRCIGIFQEQAASVMGTRRDGDQYGALFAGAYMVTHDKAPIASEAKAFLDQFELLINEDPVDKEDEELCLDEIMSYKMQIGDNKISIGVWLRLFFSRYNTVFDREDYDDLTGIDEKKIKRELEDHGIKPDAKKNEVHIALGHPVLQKILRTTPWADTYGEIIERVDYYVGKSTGSGQFGSLKKRFKSFKMEEMLTDGVPF